MNKALLALAAAAVMVLFMIGTASSALYVRGMGTMVGGDGTEYKLIYDSDLDITWLDYTQGSDRWLDQVNWAYDLAVNFDGKVYENWRLPRVNESYADYDGGVGYEGPDAFGYHDYWRGFNMTNSEMGYLFSVTLGNTAYQHTDGSYPSSYGLENSGPFENLINSDYWSGTEYSVWENNAWLYQLSRGAQGYDGINANRYAVAVFSGDIAAVPAPAALLLLATGLAGFARLKRKLD